MAKNLGRKYATMSEDERLRFAQEEEKGTRDRPAELDFDEPREEHLGRDSTARPDEKDDV